MSKTIAGFLLLAGLVASAISGSIGSWAANIVANPADDWKYDLLSYLSMAGILLGVAMFFFGALVFARKTA